MVRIVFLVSVYFLWVIGGYGGPGFHRPYRYSCLHSLLWQLHARLSPRLRRCHNAPLPIQEDESSWIPAPLFSGRKLNNTNNRHQTQTLFRSYNTIRVALSSPKHFVKPESGVQPSSCLFHRWTRASPRWPRSQRCYGYLRRTCRSNSCNHQN